MDERSKLLRRMIVEALDGGGRGHLGSSMSLVEILRVLYDSYLNLDSNNPDWSDRDRIILSKGHGCIALYAIMADKGFMPREELKTFCRLDSRIGGHPERGKVPGIEASTGALGHGLPMGVGMALAARIMNKEHRVVVICGDGEINEGSVWEAAASASKHKLSNLTVFIDYNKLQSYGPVSEVLNMEPLGEKWRSFGFEVIDVDGHNVSALENVMKQLPLNIEKPTVVICHTIKGKGFYFAENKAEWHHKSGLKPEEIADMYACLE
jgi:transketolase